MTAAIISAWMLLAVPQQAVCDTDCIVRVNQPVIVFTDASPTEVQNCRLWINGSPAAGHGTFNGHYLEFAFPGGFSRGTYTFHFTCAFIGGSEQVYTDPGTLTVRPGRVRFK